MESVGCFFFLFLNLDRVSNPQLLIKPDLVLSIACASSIVD
jgi:hypothetical protein